MAPSAVAHTPSFGALLKRYRRAAGLTQEALAERAGYSVGHISKLESSARLPVSATVELLAESLNLTPVELTMFERAARRDAGASRESRQPLVFRGRHQPLLIGRSELQARIEQFLTDPGPPLLLLPGELGVGKSRLLQDAAESGIHAGWFVLEATCRRHGQHGPYHPLLVALAEVVRTTDPLLLHTVLTGCSWLARLLPELAELDVVTMPVWTLPADQERRLIFAAVQQFLRNIAGPAGTLVVVDNLQWMGADSIDLLNELVQAAPTSLVRIIGAYRHNEVRHQDPFAVLIADLARDGLVRSEMVDPLAHDAATELLDALLADEEHVNSELRTKILRQAEGVPFLLVSYAQWLRTHIAQEQRVPDELELPWDVTQVLRQRVAALPDAAKAVVQIAALTDGDDPLTLLRAVAQRLGYDEMAVVTGIDAACEAGMLVERNEATFAFAQNLMQQVVVNDLGAARRAQLHHEIAEALARERNQQQIEVLAEHYVEAGEPDKAIPYLEWAAVRAETLHARAAAEQYYRSLISHLNVDTQAGEVAYALEHLGIILALEGHFDEAITELDHALEAYRAAGRRDGQGRAVARLGDVYALRGDVEQGIARLESEMADIAGFPDRSLALIYLSLARLYFTQHLYAQGLASAEHAANLTHGRQDVDVSARAAVERGTALDMLDRVGESLPVWEDAAIPLTRAIGDLWTQAAALEHTANDHIRVGDFEEARRNVKRGMAVALQLDDPLITAMMERCRGVLGFHTGNWRRAYADLKRADVAFRSRHLLFQSANVIVWLGIVELARGRSEVAHQYLSRGINVADGAGDIQTVLLAHCALAESEVLAGHPDEARIRLEPFLAGTRYRESDITPVLALLGWAHLEVGDTRQAEALVAASVTRAAAVALRCVLVDALRIQALVAARADRWHDAQRTITEALTLAHRLSYPYGEAKTHLVCFQIYTRRGDLQQAHEHFAAAHRILSQLGEGLYGKYLSLDRTGQSLSAKTVD